MLRDFREQLGLTRQEVEQLTGRSSNFIVKAEQYAFPTAPAALVEFYHKQLDMDRELIKDAYRQAQREQRCRAFDLLIPHPNPNSTYFITRWLSVKTLTTPTEYLVSKALCVPAAAVYYSTKNPTKPLPLTVQEALLELLDVIDSGEMYFDSMFESATEAQTVHNGLFKIVEDYCDGY